MKTVFDLPIGENKRTLISIKHIQAIDIDKDNRKIKFFLFGGLNIEVSVKSLETLDAMASAFSDYLDAVTHFNLIQ